jgi:hypothetical protein
MIDGLMTWFGESPGFIQRAMALTIPIFWLWYYESFVGPLFRFATRYVGLTAVVAVLYLMVYGLVGADLGIPYLFWHDDFWARASSAAGATMLLAVVGIIAYYLDPYPWATARKIARFLKSDDRTEKKHRWWRQLTFAMNALIDPIAITPFRSLLEPDQEHSRMLLQFLRVVRGPFLLLLLAPALLPGVFNDVPRAAPTGKLGLERLRHLEEPPIYDVSRHAGGYLIGLAAWLGGIAFGVLVIRLFICLGSLLHRTRVPGKIYMLLSRVGRKIWSKLQQVFSPGAMNRAGENAGAHPAEVERSQESAHADCPLAAASGCPGTGCPRGEPDGRLATPTDCVAPGQRHIAAIIFALLFLTAYLLLTFIQHLRGIASVRRHPLSGLLLFDLPPAFAICVALAIVAMVYATIAYLYKGWQAVVVLLVVAWLGYANNDPFKYRFENVGYQQSDIVPLRMGVYGIYGEPTAANAIPDHLVRDADALEKWKTNVAPTDSDLDSKGRPKLVLVSVSGGATRSAYWTAVVLERTLGEKFGDRVRIISGASGGMLGAACYVTYRRAVAESQSNDQPELGNPELAPRPGSLFPAWIRKDLPMRSMDPLARAISLTEFWNMDSPRAVPADRGIILERDWTALRYPFVDLHNLEADGKVPSLIFAPMLVEDGRRLLISNLELSSGADGWPSSPIIEAACRQINQDEHPDQGEQPDQSNQPGRCQQGSQVDPSKLVSKAGTAHRRLSLSSLEYFRIFSRVCHRGLYLSTAVRMSASFPFVSPAVNLPTEPPRRVVDAGYYDNYGVQIATSWIRRNSCWLAKNTSGVLLVQIRDSSSYRDRLDVDDSDPGLLDFVSRGFQLITSPIDAVASARNSTCSFRNDADVAALDSFQWDFGPDPTADREPFFTSVIFENSAEVSLDPGDFWRELSNLYYGRSVKRDFREVSMSWYLARAERDATAAAIPRDPPAGKVGGMDWSVPENRRMMIDRLYHETLQLSPGPDRAIRLKRLDQLYNYERLLNLKTWWNRKGR